MGLYRKLLSGVKKLPCGWIKANVHSSLLFTLALLVIGLLVISSLRPGLAELRTLALTLPVIWVVSLAVRIAAQHLSIGEDSLEFQIKLGPTGNLSTDYEFLRPIQILKYSVAGHAATLFLVVLGMVITAAVLPMEQSQKINLGIGNRATALLDVHGGWGSLAWASQILWVNLIIGVLNLLPTIPFDNRAMLYSLFLLRRHSNETVVLRDLSTFNSHLAAFFLGTGFAALGLSLIYSVEPIGWYAVTAAGVYLFVASRWEVSRSLQLEEQCVQLEAVTREHHQKHSHHGSKHHRGGGSDILHGSELAFRQTSDEPSSAGQSATKSERRMHVSEAYLDEILRKLHREGTSSLSIREQEALLTASRKLREKHKS